jgi:hypothetical protein
MGEGGQGSKAGNGGPLASLSLACGPKPWLKELGMYAAWSQVLPRVFLKNLMRTAKQEEAGLTGKVPGTL